MRLLNKKGFILVETLIVTTFVMALFVLVYQVVIPSMGEYEKMASYDDIDSIYASNLLKQMITRYANTEYIDEYLKSNTYINMNDCNDKNLYINADYCQKLKENLSVSEKDFIFITDYDISKFREEVKTDDYFDSGDLSNFRNYVATVSNSESFYDEDTTEYYIGKYRLFMTRTVTEADFSTSRKFVNIGVYAGGYQKYIMGQEIIFDPGDGEKIFYALKNSSSVSSTVTLILADNLPNSNVTFNKKGTEATIPDTALAKLKTGTENWTNVDLLTDFYTSLDGYTIDYSNYRSRLLNENDIMEVLGCQVDDATCFNYKEAFSVEFDTAKLSFLVSNLSDNNGYWTAATVPGSKRYAWSIQNGKVVPTLLTESTTIGIRPVITVSKEKLK